jgi:glutathione S-transferase
MLFYDSVGPNPQVVRIFAAERGVDLPKTTIDLRGGENRQAAYMAKNPSGQMPALELDGGFVLAEITAICEYLDEVGPAGTSLIGATAQERAETRMWVRRLDLNILEPLANGFRFAEGLKLFAPRIHEADLARWPDRRPGIHLRQPAHAGGYPAVLFSGFRRQGRPADQRGERQHRRPPRPHEGAAFRFRLRTHR